MKRTLLAITLIGILGLSFMVSLSVDSYYGYHSGSECSLCHNEPATAYNSTFYDSSITLDGEVSEGEDFWEEAWKRQMYIPVAGGYGSDHLFVVVIFSQNSTHLFMKLDWDDYTPINGTTQAKQDPADGISVMFNINAEDFADCYSQGMYTANEGELVDTITWKAHSDAEGTVPEDTNGYTTVPVKSGIVNDYVMTDAGIKADSQNDVQTAAVYGNVSSHHEHNYQVEIVRPLVTDDPNDVQFDEPGYYEFALALYNDSNGADHTTSFQHSVWVYADVPEETTTTDEDTADIFTTFGLATLVVLSSAVMMVRRRTKA